MNRFTTVLLAIIIALSCGVACETPTAIPVGAFSHPIDLAYACEGPTHTVAPDNDERPEAFSSFERTRMCPDVSTSAGSVQGYLLGMVLNQHPPTVSVVQMNPAGSGGTRVLDTDLFIPGLTPIPVGDGPTSILTAPEWDAFYVVSSGSGDLTHIVVGQVQGLSSIGVETTRIPLPGRPGVAKVLGAHLLVASAHTPELWVLKGDGSSDVVTIQLPAPVQDMDVLAADLVLTWTERPVVSRWQITDELLEGGGSLSITSPALQEEGLVAPCSDTLDNDGDALVDAADPDCGGPDDSEDLRSLDAPSDEDAPAPYDSTSLSPCSDGLDNDRDGLTDEVDPSCWGEDPQGEFIAGCSDGLDGDGDGRVDLADPDCYGPNDLSERARRGWGPTRLAVVDAGQRGRFIYVLNQGDQELAAFDATEEASLSRIQVPAHQSDVPTLSYVPYDAMPSGAVTELTGRPIPGLPGPTLHGEMNLSLPNPVAGDISAGRLRGELWSRLIEAVDGEERPTTPLGLSSAVSRRPSGCDPDVTDRCAQPAGDDDTWFLFLPRMDGRIQLVEVLGRGAPVHRHAQSETDLDQRTASLPIRPALSVAGDPVFVGTSPIGGHPLLGPMVRLEEVVPVETGVAPPLYRSYGVWLDDDPEQVATEVWSVTYEGALPIRGGHLARMLDDTRIYDPRARHCDGGVEPGDWLVIHTPYEGVHPDLRLESLEVVTSEGAVCETLPPSISIVEVPATAVGLTTVSIDPTQARLRHTPPALDDQAIEAEGLSAAACAEALEDLLLSPDWMEPVATDGFASSALPGRFSYEVRPDDTWVVTGSRSGFLHRQVWTVDPETGEGSCEVDDELSERATGRAYTARLNVQAYAQCPPSNGDLSLDLVDDLFADDHQRFSNYSFSLDVFPGCDQDSGTGSLLTAIRQDTTWSFLVEGPDSPRSVSGSDIHLTPRVPVLGFRRQQVQLDSALSRILLLEIRPGSSASLQSHF